MHAEKKHKYNKCSNSYGIEWDLKRHAEDCGKTFQCTCGRPYASRTALRSHIYRTGVRSLKGTGTHLPPPLLPLKGRASQGVTTRTGLQVWTGVRNTLVPGAGSPFIAGPGTASVPPPEEGPCGQDVKARLEPTGLPARPDPSPRIPSALSASPSTRTSPGLSLLPSWPVMSLAWAGPQLAPHAR